MNWIILLIALATLSGSQALAQTEDSKSYNLLQGSLDTSASMAKAIFALKAAEANVQTTHDFELGKVCFRLGTLVESANRSLARYEFHAVDPAQKARGQEAMRLALQAATFCGLKTEDIIGREAAKALAGVADLSEIGSISSAVQLSSVLSEIHSLMSEN